MELGPWSLRAHGMSFPASVNNYVRLENTPTKQRKHWSLGLFNSYIGHAAYWISKQDNLLCFSSVASPYAFFPPERGVSACSPEQSPVWAITFCWQNLPQQWNTASAPLALNCCTALAHVEGLCSSLEMAAPHGWKMQCLCLCTVQNSQLWTEFGIKVQNGDYTAESKYLTAVFWISKLYERSVLTFE